jgi:serine/threonine protein kinase/tetratricopeptide (TPR) repeat protein
MTSDSTDWVFVRQVFEGALAQPLEARRSYLADACGGDRSLEVRVEQLLAAHDQSTGFLDTQASISATTSPPPMDGRLIGPYLLTERIGAGGMGEVYRARDTRLDRVVAVKVLLRQGVHDAGTRERFEREARAVAALNHPHICTLYDVGTSDDIQFLVMEFVDGQMLRGPLPVEEAVRLAIQIASAVAAAHRQGILHRDIKPGNVLVTSSGVKLLDFGLAKAISTEVDVTATAAGTVLGTAPYMSPEQVQGLRLDARSDVFSFGAVLYEMVSGNRAFEGASIPEVLSAVLRDAPAPLWPPSPLEGLIVKCLSKEPRERFQSMDEVGRALAQIDLGPVKTQPSIAVLAFESLSGDPEGEYFSDGIAEEIINALTQIEAIRVAARTSSFSFKGKGIDAAEIARKLGVRHLLQGSVRRAGSRVRVTAQLVDASNGFQIWSERYDRELADIFDVQDEIARAIVRRLKVALDIRQAGRIVKVSTTNMEAYQAYLKGRVMLYRRGPWIAPALENLRRAVDLDPGHAQALAGLADAYTVLGYSGLRRPEEVMPAAIDAATRALDSDPDSAEAHTALAMASLMWERDFKKAERGFLEALRLNPNYIQARCWYALFFLQWSAARPDEGVEQALLAYEADPLSAYTATIVSFALATVGRFEEARSYALIAVEQDPDSFLGRWMLAWAYRFNGDTTKAVVLLQELWSASPNCWVAIQVVPTYAESGRLAEARDVYEQMLARRTREYVPPFALALCASGLGEHEAAIAFTAEAIEGRDVLLPAFYVWTPGIEKLRADPRFADCHKRFNERARG